MNENDFIFYALHKSHGEHRIINFFNGMSGNNFQALHQHLILVCGNLQCFFFCARPSEAAIFNLLVQKEESITFSKESLYPVRTLPAK